jgi:hypothetical protein
MSSYSWYRVEWSSLAVGKVIASSKRRLVFKFGFVNAEAIAQGLTGAACRGDEHVIVIGFSLTTGKRAVTYDKKVVYYTEGRSIQEGKFEHSWTIEGGHNVRISAHFSQPHLRRQYDMFINGESFFSMPHIYELGTNLTQERLKPGTKTIAPVVKDRPNDIPSGYERDHSTFDVSCRTKKNEEDSCVTGSQSNLSVCNEKNDSPQIDLLDFNMDFPVSFEQTLSPSVAYNHNNVQQLSLYCGPEQKSLYPIENAGSPCNLFVQPTTLYQVPPVQVAVNPFLVTSSTTGSQGWNATNAPVENPNKGFSRDMPTANCSRELYFANNQPRMNQNSHSSGFSNSTGSLNYSFTHDGPAANSSREFYFASNQQGLNQNNQSSCFINPSASLYHQESQQYSSPASPLGASKALKGFEPVSPTSTTAVEEVQQDLSQILQMNGIEDRFRSIVNLDDMTAPYETPEQQKIRLQKEAKYQRKASTAAYLGINQPQPLEVMRSHQPPNFTGAQSGGQYTPQLSSPAGFLPNTPNFQPQHQHAYY